MSTPPESLFVPTMLVLRGPGVDMDRPNFMSLPPELHLQIICLLPAKTIHTVRQLCHYTWDLIDINQASSTGPGIKKSLQRIRSQMRQYCYDLPAPEAGLESYAGTFIVAFLEHLSIPRNNNVINLVDDTFADFYYYRSTPCLPPTTCTRHMLFNFADWLGYIVTTFERHIECEPCHKNSTWVWEDVVPSLIDVTGSDMGLDTKEKSDALSKTLMQFSKKLRVLDDESSPPRRRKFALTTQRVDKLTALERYQEHLLLESVLGCPAPPGLAPITYYGNAKFVQDLVFEAYVAKEPIDHVARAAALEEICVGHFENDMKCERERRIMNRRRLKVPRWLLKEQRLATQLQKKQRTSNAAE